MCPQTFTVEPFTCDRVRAENAREKMYSDWSKKKANEVKQMNTQRGHRETK